jgi:Flp pilus assembly protein TadG
MITRLHRALRDETGMSLVFVGVGMFAFLAASMLAIDVGMLMTARNQAQNSADAGALAGATALYFDDFDDRSASGPAVTNAINGAMANAVMADTVSVEPADIEFLNDPTTGESNRVKVTVHRTAAKGNPLSLLVARTLSIATAGAIGLETSDMRAVAIGEASPANAMTCVKPFTIPDKWKEVGSDAPWTGDSDYDAFDNKGVPLPASEADVYIPAYNDDGSVNPDYTGYNTEANRGQPLVLRAATGNNINVSFYYSLSMTDDMGGSDYRWNIANCNKSIYHWGDPLIQEPGAMEGPTIQGAEELIAKDPNAFWNDATNKVEGSAYGVKSPRIFPIPLYDPEYYDDGKRNGRNASLRTANWIGFFLESTEGNGIYGRIIPIAGIRDKTGFSGSASFPKAIRLVQ